MPLHQSFASEAKTASTCPECAGAMTISAISPNKFEHLHEDIAYWCSECGTKQIRTLDTRWPSRVFTRAGLDLDRISAPSVRRVASCASLLAV
jgi:hypothetical protein